VLFELQLMLLIQIALYQFELTLQWPIKVAIRNVECWRYQQMIRAFCCVRIQQRDPDIVLVPRLMVTCVPLTSMRVRLISER
jgi:hypothetical protein